MKNSKNKTMTHPEQPEWHQRVFFNIYIYIYIYIYIGYTDIGVFNLHNNTPGIKFLVDTVSRIDPIDVKDMIK